MKSQASFSSKYKSKKLECRLLQFLCGTLRVNIHTKLHKTVLRRVHTETHGTVLCHVTYFGGI